MTRRERTRSWHRSTGVSFLCSTNDFSMTVIRYPASTLTSDLLMMLSGRAKEELCPHPFGHQPAAQPGSSLSSPVATPPPPFRRQPGPPLLRGGAGTHQLRRQQEVGVCAPPAARRPPQQRLQRRGGAGPLRLRVARCLGEAAR